MPEDSRTVDLPAELVSRVEQRVGLTEFQSVETYIEFVLEEVLENVETASKETDAEQLDEEQVQKRLESLGYLRE